MCWQMGGFLYRTHLSGLHSGASITSQEWLYNSLYHRGQQNLVWFVLARTFGVFQFVFGQLAAGDVAGILFVMGVAYLVGGPQGLKPGAFSSPGGRAEAVSFPKPIDKTRPDERTFSRSHGVLVAFPFLLTCGAAIARVYPYGGTRHSAFLIPFAIAGVSLGIAWLLQQNMVRGLAVALAVVAVSAAFGSPHRPLHDAA